MQVFVTMVKIAINFDTGLTLPPQILRHGTSEAKSALSENDNLGSAKD